MEKENNGGALSGRRNPRAVLRSPSPSPRLCRSKSGSNLACMITTPENNYSSRRFGSSHNTSRSKSTSKTRRIRNEENIINSSSIATISRKSQESNNSNSSSRDNSVGASKRATLKSPSAWALSPGRFLGSPAASESPGKVKNSDSGSGHGGMSKVLKYFRQKKVSSVQEEEYQRFRILHNRLLQWRFVNARAEASMANVKKAAEINLFSVWLRILIVRKMIIEKKTETQKLKHRIKLYKMMNPQVWLLNEWAKMEKKNEEYVSRLTRKLLALSTCWPLDDVKADVESVYEAMKTAEEIMESLNPLIRKHQTQVERILYQVTELTAISKQLEEYSHQLLRILPIFATSAENEKSIIVHHIQTTKIELKKSTSVKYVIQSM